MWSGVLSDTHPTVRAEATEAATAAILLPSAPIAVQQRLHRLLISLLSDSDDFVRSHAVSMIASLLPRLESGHPPIWKFINF